MSPRGKRRPLSEETKRKISLAHVKTGHGAFPSGTPQRNTYNVWAKMRYRCLNPLDPAYRNYGGRGITVCTRWLDYENFVEDMGLKPDGLSLERIDNDGDYEKSNCKWATRQEQARNRRSNHRVLIGGVERTLAEWAELTGVKTSTLRARIKYNGAEAEDLLAPPSRYKKGGPPFQTSRIN